MKRPRALAHRDRPLGQGHALVAAQGARTPDRRPARHALRGPARQPRALPRVPAARGAAAALPPRRSAPGAGAPGRLARLGQPLPTAAVRPAGAHAQVPPPGHPRRDPPRALQWPPRGPQQQDPPHQPPQLRLSLRRRPDRPRLPLLYRHHDRPAAMNFTTKRSGPPDFALFMVEALTNDEFVHEAPPIVGARVGAGPGLRRSRGAPPPPTTGATR